MNEFSSSFPKTIFSYFDNNIISATFDSVFYAISRCGRTHWWHSEARLVESITTQSSPNQRAFALVRYVWRLRESEIFRPAVRMRFMMIESRGACCGSPWRACRDEVRFAYIANEIPRDDDTHIHPGNIKETGIITLQNGCYHLIRRPSRIK